MSVTVFTPQNIDQLRLVLGGLSDERKVTADADTGTTEKAVGELRVRTTWPTGLRLQVSRPVRPEMANGAQQNIECTFSWKGVDRWSCVLDTANNFVLAQHIMEAPGAKRTARAVFVRAFAGKP
jgi:hypothetical protein